MTAATRRALVGVSPAAQTVVRRRLFDALEQALPVRFEGRDEGSLRDLDGVVELGSDRARGVAGPPRFAALGEERREAGVARSIAVTDRADVDHRLRGARLTDCWVDVPLSACARAGEPLAIGHVGPLWALAEGRVLSAAAPAELAPEESLRDRLLPGRSIALLALVHFLRRLAAEVAFAPPPLQAAFIVDDPNLHWTRYGHIDYRALARQAAEHRYHVSFAMVPLDGWLVHPAAARLFREHPQALSILVHGNDHVDRELARPASAAEGRALAVAALRRVAAFERRAGVRVCRVMAPPHERVSEPAARGLLAAGFEAACMSRPYPWLAHPQRSFLVHPAGAGPLTGWRPADAVAGGLPVLLRNAFSHPREDLVLRAFLDQPLLLYGHHASLAAPTALADAAAQVNRLGDVRWRPLSAIGRALADTRREGSTLLVRPWTRRVEIDAPAGVERIVVSPAPELDRGGQPRVVDVDAPGRVTITAGPAGSGVTAVHAPAKARPRAWPLARRIAGEGRDRLAPMLNRR